MANARPSPLVVLLGAVLFFSANVFAVAAVLGVDLGTQNIKATLVRPGRPLEIVLTKDARRKETSAVAFTPSSSGPKADRSPKRLYGADAMAVAARFPDEVYPNLKTLLGLPIDDASVKEYAARHPALQLQAHSSRGTVAFKNKMYGDDWLVEEILSMELSNVQKNAEAAAGNGLSVQSVVITVPPFYTVEEKRAVQLAAELAGLKVLSLISDGLAVGLHYATSRQFPNVNAGEKPEYHMVFDMGAGSTSASVLRFQSRTVKDVGKSNKTVQEVQVLGGGWDKALGGDSLNHLIVDDMISQFVETKGAKSIPVTAQAVRSHGRTMAKLAKEAERQRLLLSANQDAATSFEQLFEGVDFKYKTTRAAFETMAETHAERIEAVVNDAVKMSGIEPSDLTSILLHGGATHTPFVQKALGKIVGSADKVRSSVNSDEAAVFGAGFRAAELSPSFRVKEIRISEGSMYAAGLKRASGEKRQRVWTATSPLGDTKEITFTNHNDLALSFYQQVGDDDRDIASLSTKNLTATVAAIKEKYPSCAESEIVFKLGVKLRAENGEIEVARAAVECEAEVTVKERIVDGVKNLFGLGKKDQKPLKDDDKTADSKGSESSEEAKSSSSSSTVSGATESAAPTEEVKEVKKKQMVSIPVEVVLEKAGVPALTKSERIKIRDRLKAFAASDKARLEREETRNQLETYAYEARQLLEEEAFIGASTEKERADLAKQSSVIGEWLYEDGVDATTEVFKAKLKTLEDIVLPVQSRIDEAAQRPKRIVALKESIKRISEYLDSVHKQIAEYEAWEATADSASTSEPSTSTTSAPAESPTGEFDGLEDDDAKDAGKEANKDGKREEQPGPNPPLFEREDLKDLETLVKTTKDWLSEMQPKQEKLPPTANPVLLVKDISEKIQKLDKVSMDLAMKGTKRFGPKAKKAAHKLKKMKSKKGEGAEDSKDQRMTEEQLEELMEKIKAMEKEKQAEKTEKGKETDEKAGHDEL
ncbi:heat shock protein 70-like protein [Metarhizium album ARSEF 1941]|uniref:Heat shock protein 70-like protein n=1 Tax=Metarhizium album (strain ARSEF 1941) TaxID=1081103 RepID=A0A0B2X0I1_METAS|nr:heat shock protein 70-like protein [Metarhizium album ARSEF 1941]KHN99177.1 heat shock protein 70-like protein [Metarhizium album ARSEF 1941]